MNLVKNSDQFANEEFHVGANLVSGNWLWMPKREKIVYQMKWYPGEPNLEDSMINCLTVKKTKDDVGFKNVNHYSDARRYVCEKNVSPVDVTM